MSVFKLFGTPVGVLALFVVFGILIGVLFSFFGMGGSLLVTPALFVMGYPSRVTVGSGFAFVFGTSVIATLKHRDLEQVDYKLGISMIIGTMVSLEVGKEIVLYLEELGLAGNVISITYVLLLGGTGLFVTYEALKGSDGGGVSHDVDGDADIDADDIPELVKKIQSYSLPPMITLHGGVKVSLRMILLLAFATGLLSGFLGVDGGFICMPALFYLIGAPVPIAVGIDLFEIMFSGGVGSFLYAQSGGVDLSIVTPLLTGSALSVRVGSAATSIVDEDEIKIYFGLMLFLGALAVAVRQAGNYPGVGVLDYVSLALIFGSAFMVSGTVLYNAVKSMRAPSTAGSSTAD